MYSFISNYWNNNKLEVTIPSSGSYVLLVRSDVKGASTIADIKIDDRMLYPGNPITGAYIDVIGNQTGAHLISNVTGGSPSSIFLEEPNGFIPGKIKLFSLSGYAKASNYNWSSSNGVRVDNPSYSIQRAVLVSNNPYIPTITGDVYLGLPLIPSRVKNQFSNLHINDGLQTDEGTTVYNCIAYSIGSTSHWEWPEYTWSSYYIEGATSYEMFRRMYELKGYELGNVSNHGIALWARFSSNGSFESFSHASIRKNPGSANPHGYDHESKDGINERFMHPKDDLLGPLYGRIAYYFKPKATRNSLFGDIYENRIEDEFESSEMSVITQMAELIPTIINEEFEQKYLAWERTWFESDISIHSNPKEYAKSKEYKELLVYCQKTGKASWPLIFRKLSNERIFILNLLSDLMLDNYSHVLKEIKQEHEFKFKYSDSPMPSMYSNAINFCKRILSTEKEMIFQEIKNTGIKNEIKPLLKISSDQSNVYLELYSSQKDEKGFVQIYDIYGNSVYKSQIHDSFENDKYIKTLNKSILPSGIYIVSINWSGETLTQKLAIEK